MADGNGSSGCRCLSALFTGHGRTRKRDAIVDRHTLQMNDRIQETELPPLKEAPPNLAALAAGPFVDGVHVRLKLNFDVTHLSEDRQKLLLHMVSQGVKEFEKSIQEMDRITVAARLGKLERVKETKGNGL